MSATMECVGGPWDGEKVVFPDDSPDAHIDVVTLERMAWLSSITPTDIVGCYIPDFENWVARWCEG